MKTIFSLPAAAAAAAAATLAELAAAYTPGQLSCLDGSGNPQDYWYIFKFNQGWDYAYMDHGHSLAQGPGTLDQDSSALAATLNQFYKNYKVLSYAEWNDEYPNGTTVESPTAHAKGVVFFDGKSGVWITHSLPKFMGTPQTGNPDFKTPSDRYGQSFLCITIDKAGFDVLSQVAPINRYSVYDSADNAKMGTPFTDWAIDGKTSDTTTLVTTFKSAGGQEFTIFAKSALWKNELYEGLVAPYYKADLQTETWQNGVGKIPSWCKGSYAYNVENVKSVNFPGKEFKESDDHSKWAITKTGYTFCVGDINRQEGQMKRGGGTICITSARIASNMHPVVDTVAECSKEETPTYIV